MARGVRLGQKRGSYNWINGKPSGRPRKPLIPFVWTEQSAELIGYLAGDGHIDTHSVGIHFSYRELDLEIRYLRAMEEVFGTPAPKRCLKPSIVSYYYGSRDLRDFLQELRIKSVVPDMVGSDEKLACSYLRGFFTADGSISTGQGQISMSQTDTELFSSIAALMKYLGIDSNEVESKARVTSFRGRVISSKPYKKAVIRTPESWHLFAEKVGFSTQRKIDLLKKFQSLKGKTWGEVKKKQWTSMKLLEGN